MGIKIIMGSQLKMESLGEIKKQDSLKIRIIGKDKSNWVLRSLEFLSSSSSIELHEAILVHLIFQNLLPNGYFVFRLCHTSRYISKMQRQYPLLTQT
ncbi:hypothetical protein P8452_26685 [Trifolium repens]|nr:hypothetical protein P8452_26685 [Trifolium repens]